MIKFLKDVLQCVVLVLTAIALIFIIIWGLRVENVIDKFNTPDVPAPTEPVQPYPLY